MNRVIPVFRTGTHTDSAGVERTFTAETLRAMADKFDPSVGAAPIVKGHPATDDPAYGWVERFLFEESTGVLYAVPKQVDPDFANEVRAGRYNRVSIALYPPSAKNNPVPGMYYPRHVGYLGAASPAVTGLKAANFNADNEGFLMFDLTDDKQTIKFTDALAGALSRALIAIGFKPGAGDGRHDGSPAPIDVKTTAEYKALEATKIEMETNLANEQKIAAALKAQQARSGIVTYTEGLVTAGKLSPVEAGRVVEVLFALDAAAEIEFSEGKDADKKTVKAKPADLLRGVLDNLPKRIEYEELSGKDKDGISHIGFTAPEGALVSGGAKLELHRRATAYAAEHKVDYLDAVTIVSRGQ